MIPLICRRTVNTEHHWHWRVPGPHIIHINTGNSRIVFCYSEILPFQRIHRLPAPAPYIKIHRNGRVIPGFDWSDFNIKVCICDFRRREHKNLFIHVVKTVEETVPVGRRCKKFCEPFLSPLPWSEPASFATIELIKKKPPGLIGHQESALIHAYTPGTHELTWCYIFNKISWIIKTNDPVIAGVRYIYPVFIYTHIGGIIELSFIFTVPSEFKNKFSRVIEFLYTVIAGINDIDISLPVNSHTFRAVKTPLPASAAASSRKRA